MAGFFVRGSVSGVRLGMLLFAFITCIIFIVWFIGAKPKLDTNSFERVQATTNQSIQQAVNASQASLSPTSHALQMRAELHTREADGSQLSDVYLGLANYSSEVVAEWLRDGRSVAALKASDSVEDMIKADLERWILLPTTGSTDSAAEFVVEAQGIPQADVYHLVALDSNQQVYIASLSHAHSQQVSLIDFGRIDAQASSIIRLIPDAEVSQLKNLAVSLMPTLDDERWRWLQMLYYPETEPLNLANAMTNSYTVWWEELTPNSAFHREWGPLPIAQEFRVTLSWLDTVKWKVQPYVLSPGHQDLPVVVSDMLSSRAAAVDLEITLVDALNGAALSDWSILRLPRYNRDCKATDEEGKCLLKHIDTAKPTQFHASKTVIVPNSDEPITIDVLPPYPNWTAFEFDPLAHQESLLSGQQQLSVSWRVPRLRWLRVNAQQLARFQQRSTETIEAMQTKVAPEHFPLFQLQKRDAENGWQLHASEHFLKMENGELWLSIERAGEYRLLVALDALHFMTSQAISVPPITAGKQQLLAGEIQFPGRAHQPNILHSLTGALMSLNQLVEQEQIIAVYCAENPLTPLTIMLQRALALGLDSLGCQQIVFETDDGQAESLVFTYEVATETLSLSDEF